MSSVEKSLQTGDPGSGQGHAVSVGILSSSASPLFRGVISAYAVPAVAILLAIATVYVVDTPAPFSSFILAIIVATWLNGRMAGWVTLALSSAILAHYFRGEFTAAGWADLVPRFAHFLAISAFIVWLVGAERRAIDSLCKARDDLQRHNESLRRENLEGKALEGFLRQSGDQLRLIIDTIPAMAWIAMPDGRLEFLNRRWLDYSGMSLEEGLADAVRAVHPEDAPRALALWTEASAASKGYEQEMRLRRADGVYRWFLVRIVPLFDGDGAVVRWYGISTEIEQRKRVEEDLHRLTRRLLEVHEEERRNLSRELHDEFGQLLAAVSLHLEAARNAGTPGAQASLDEAMALLGQASGHMRRLALELRPRILEAEGLDATLRWLAAEHQRHTGVRARVLGRCGKVPPGLETACYRVVQQALTNVAQHARASQVRIEAWRAETDVMLSVTDDGIGFRVAAAPARPGHLGLLGMKERVEILGGTFKVVSEPGQGTSIRVSLPLPA